MFLTGLLTHYLLSLLYQSVQDHIPRAGSAHCGLALLHPSLIKKMSHRLALQTNLPGFCS